MSCNEVLYVRSSKKNKLRSDDTSTSDDEEDVWDDTLLIEAYDKAVDRAQSEVLKNLHGSEKGKENESMSKKKMQWQIGDKCRCKYSEDNCWYEADIIDIIEVSGMCVVKYVGYENKDMIPLGRLKPSKGDSSRALQISQALMDRNVESGASLEKVPEVDNTEQDKRNALGKGNRTTKAKETKFSQKDRYTSLSQPATMGTSIPPPPPPHLFSDCGDNISETEAMSAMLMSWYMSGYHTGYYHGLKAGKKK